MNKTQQSRYESLYQQHVNALKRQGKSKATIDGYCHALRQYWTTHRHRRLLFPAGKTPTSNTGQRPPWIVGAYNEDGSPTVHMPARACRH